MSSWTDWAGIVGAGTGTLALFVQAMQYGSAMPRLKFEIQPECAVFRNEFLIENNESKGEGSYKPATHITITNTGGKSLSISNIKVIAESKLWYHALLKKLFPFLKWPFINMSQSNSIVEQTHQAPFVLDPGHAWMGILDLEYFRNARKNFPYVFLAIKVAHNKRTIKKVINLNG